MLVSEPNHVASIFVLLTYFPDPDNWEWDLEARDEWKYAARNWWDFNAKWYGVTESHVE